MDHATLNRWVLKYVPPLDQALRARKRPVGSCWRMDETYVRVKGPWEYLYRAVDQAGTTVDFLLTAKRDRKAALRFLRKAIKWNGTPEMFLIRDIVFSHEAVRDWEPKLTPALAETLRRRRRGKAGRSWYVDETYISVQGHWRYLYRAIDRSGALVDVMFSEQGDMAATKTYFRSAKMVTGITPDRVTTDGDDGYPRAPARQQVATLSAHRPSTTDQHWPASDPM